MFLHHMALGTTHGSDFFEESTKGIVDFLLLYFKTQTTCVINDYTYIITTPSVILLDAYTPYKYYPNGPTYIDDYLHFCADDSSKFKAELTFPLNTPIPLSNDSTINTLLHTLEYENKPHQKISEQVITLLIQLLMVKIGDNWEIFQNENPHLPHYQELLQVRNNILSSPEKGWTIEELADMAHLSSAYFQVLYKKAFGVTCMSDVINTKVSEAKTYLSSTQLPIYQIAQETGYSDVTHFIRQFKKTTGLTPGGYRKKTQNL